MPTNQLNEMDLAPIAGTPEIATPSDETERIKHGFEVSILVKGGFLLSKRG